MDKDQADVNEAMDMPAHEKTYDKLYRLCEIQHSIRRDRPGRHGDFPHLSFSLS